MEEAARPSAIWVSRWGITIVAAMVVMVMGACMLRSGWWTPRGSLITDQQQDVFRTK